MWYATVILAFGAGFLLVFGANLFMADTMETHRQQVRKRLEGELQVRNRERARRAAASELICDNVCQDLRDITRRPTWRRRLAILVDESGLAMRPRHLVELAAASATLAAIAAAVLTHRWYLAAFVAPLAGCAPFAYVAMVRQRRLARMLAQLPDAFDLMTRTMRAGQTISQAFQAVSDEFSPPIADEFGYCYEQQNLGLSPEAAMHDLARRTGLLEIKIFVLAVMVHRQTGGNLSELLEKLASVIRQRYRIHGTIRALTAEGRLQAVILLLLPPIMFAIMFVLNRSYAMVLFDYPWLLLGTAASMMIGALWMYKLIQFDF